MSEHTEPATVDADEYARLLGSLERFAREVPHLQPAELVRRTQAFESDLEAFVPMHEEVVALLHRVAERAAAGLDQLPELPDEPVDGSTTRTGNAASDLPTDGADEREGTVPS